MSVVEKRQNDASREAKERNDLTGSREDLEDPGFPILLHDEKG